MSGQFSTTVYISTVNGDDAELDVIIDYSIEKGCLPSYYEPGSDDTVFIEKISNAKTGKPIHDDLASLIVSVELEKNILEAWRDAKRYEVEDHADYKRGLEQDRQRDRVAA